MPLVERAQAQSYEPPAWMSAGEVAQAMGMHIDSVYRALKSGTCPFDYVKFGGTWRIWRRDVEEFQKSRTRVGTTALLDTAAP